MVNDSNMGNGICWLQSIEQKYVCFIMLNPLEVKKDYAPVVMQDVLIMLQAVPEDDLDCWVLMVIGETFRKSTVNLKSPVIIKMCIRDRIYCNQEIEHLGIFLTKHNPRTRFSLSLIHI